MYLPQATDWHKMVSNVNQDIYEPEVSQSNHIFWPLVRRGPGNMAANNVVVTTTAPMPIVSPQQGPSPVMQPMPSSE